MKQAVAYLEPKMEKKSGASQKGTIVIATVKGDVHDIGKNLVDIILSNNGYRVVNLGIKQPGDAIIKAAWIRFNDECRMPNAELNTSSPYSASKAGSDLLARSYFLTFKLPVVITRASNNYGPHQFPEKLIPLMITNALEGQPLPVYGDGKQVRDWIHVEDHCRGVLAALEQGEPGEVYNFGGDAERENIAIVQRIVAILGAPPSLITHVTDRPAHDRRYAMNSAKARAALGWTPRWKFEDGLAATIEWYRAHEAWWRAVKDGSYRKFYDTWYGERTA